MVDCDRVILIMVVAFSLYCLATNIWEIYIICHFLSSSYHTYSGAAFDCTFYPLIPQLVASLFLLFTILLCFTVGFCALCFSYCFTGYFEAIFLYGMYTIYGPCLLAACFYFLYNINEYSYSCPHGSTSKEYTYKTYIIVSLLGFVAVLIAFTCCIRKLVLALSRALRNDRNCFTKLINAILCRSEYNSVPHDPQEMNEPEAAPLRIENIERSQL